VCKHTVYFTLTYLLPRMLNSSTLLTFRRKMGWSCSTKCISFLSKSKKCFPKVGTETEWCSGCSTTPLLNMPYLKCQIYLVKTTIYA